MHGNSLIIIIWLFDILKQLAQMCMCTFYKMTEGTEFLCIPLLIINFTNFQVLLKFHPSFHNDYHGEDYKVRFNFNRTPLRRCHFALNYAMKQLGQDVLFPFRLKLQLPQVCYIDPEVQELTRRWKHCSSRSHQTPPVVEGTNKLVADVQESEWHLSSSKLPVVTRLFGVSSQDSDSQSYCNEGKIRVPSSPDDSSPLKENVGNEVLAADVTKRACLSKNENTASVPFQTRKVIHSEKQEDYHCSSLTKKCSLSSLKDNETQESGLCSIDKVGCLSKQMHQKKETEQPLCEHKSGVQELPNTEKSVDPHHEWKVHKVNTPFSKLIPRSLDLAVCRSANRAKLSGNNDKTVERVEILSNEKPFIKKDVVYENHHWKNDKKNKSPDGNSYKWAKEDHIFSEVCGNEQNKSSKEIQSRKFESDAAHSTVKNKTCYVIPVLPFCHSKKKCKYLIILL